LNDRVSQGFNVNWEPFLKGPIDGGAIGSSDFASNPPEQHKNDNDDQDDADDTDTTVSITVTVAAEPAAKAAQQEYDEDDNENESYRHLIQSSFCICGAWLGGHYAV
jgi:hypothetical protein